MDPMCCNENMIPVLLIMTSNAPDYGYLAFEVTQNAATERAFSGEYDELEGYAKYKNLCDE